MRLRIQPGIKGVSSIEEQKPDNRSWNLFPHVRSLETKVIDK